MTILANIALAGDHIFQVLGQYPWVLPTYLRVLSQYLLVLSRWIHPWSIVKYWFHEIFFNFSGKTRILPTQCYSHQKKSILLHILLCSSKYLFCNFDTFGCPNLPQLYDFTGIAKIGSIYRRNNCPTKVFLHYAPETFKMWS